MKKMNFCQRTEAKWGLGNYIELFQDKEGYIIRFNSVRCTVVCLAATIAISLVPAVAVRRECRGHRPGLCAGIRPPRSRRRACR